MNEPDARLALRREDLFWRVVEDDVVALDSTASTYFATNPAGTLLWEKLRTGTTRSELVEVLRDRYRIPPEQAAEEVDSFVEQLSSRGLLE